MGHYTRRQIVELLEVEDEFLVALEREEILVPDQDGEPAECFSDRMLERARAAHTLIHELEVNLPGVAVILRMREEIAELHRHLERMALEVRRSRGGT